MIHLIILIALVAAMLAMGIPIFELSIAYTMALTCIGGLAWGERWVQRRTGRTTSAPTDQYKAFNFILAMIIGVPPIFLLQGGNVLVIIAFQLVGLVVGDLVAQAFFGKRVA